MWRRDVAGYGRRRVAGEPSLCKKQSIQPAADNLVVQQRGLMDGGATVKNANYSLDQLIGGECGSSARRGPGLCSTSPASSSRAAINMHLIETVG